LHAGRPGGIQPNPESLENKMKNMKQLLQNLMAEESGQDLIEYALVAALVGLGSVASMQGLATSIATTFNGVGNALSNSVA
jgi:pilus assembly protein Flp/PilA